MTGKHDQKQIISVTLGFFLLHTEPLQLVPVGCLVDVSEANPLHVYAILVLHYSHLAWWTCGLGLIYENWSWRCGTRGGMRDAHRYACNGEPAWKLSSMAQPAMALRYIRMPVFQHCLIGWYIDTSQ
ncbi:hypothetical protein BGX38DRAFT_570348 [Terfezia claveryi]|nr:hypothetical protein BGX38DRAFT_570348 [Terfezia claveryi]